MSRPKTMEKRVNILIPPGFLEEINDWRRLQPKIPSLAEAIRHLTQWAIERQKAEDEYAGAVRQQQGKPEW